MSNIGDLQVWWVPQIPMKSFLVPVSSVAEAAKILDVLANYDLFQFENNVKPDYANSGGLNVLSADGWESWMDEETGEEDPQEYINAKEPSCQ